MKAVKGKLGGGGVIYLATLALFLFFLISSAPHFVHHSFDQSQTAPCLAFSIAKGCHLKPTSAIILPVIQAAVKGIFLSFEVWNPHFTPSPFSQRAPPVA